MQTTDDFPIRTYRKDELACLYNPHLSRRCAVRTFTRWLRLNPELYERLLQTGYTPYIRLFTPLQVRLIVRYLSAP